MIARYYADAAVIDAADADAMRAFAMRVIDDVDIISMILPMPDISAAAAAARQRADDMLMPRKMLEAMMLRLIHDDDADEDAMRGGCRYAMLRCWRLLC